MLHSHIYTETETDTNEPTFLAITHHFIEMLPTPMCIAYLFFIKMYDFFQLLFSFRLQPMMVAVGYLRVHSLLRSLKFYAIYVNSFTSINLQN